MKNLVDMFALGLCDAIKEIGILYFEIAVVGSDKTAFREKVYCYELYHQLRIKLRNFPLFIYGEPDKGGHPNFKKIGRKIPDFIVHKPQSHDFNLTVIEVKSHRSSTKRFEKDIDTVCKLVRDPELHYSWGVLLIVGGKEFKKRFLDKFDEFVLPNEQIVLLWHQNAKSKPIQKRGPKGSPFQRYCAIESLKK